MNNDKNLNEKLNFTPKEIQNLTPEEAQRQAIKIRAMNAVIHKYKILNEAKNKKKNKPTP